MNIGSVKSTQKRKASEIKDENLTQVLNENKMLKRAMTEF